MAYTKRGPFVNKSVQSEGTPDVDAAFLNNLEQGVSDAHTLTEDHAADVGENAHQETPASIGAAPDSHDHDDVYPAGDPSGAQNGYVWTYDTTSGGYLPKAIPGQPSASESAKGVVELATGAETQAGTDSERAVHPAGLKSELDRRGSGSAIGAIDNGPAIFENLTVNSSNPVPSGDLRGVGGVPADAVGIWYAAHTPPQANASRVGVSSADVTPNGGHRISGGPGQFLTGSGMLKLGTGVNAGKITITRLGVESTTGLNMYVTGWWR